MSERHDVPAGFAARIGAAELQALREEVAVDPDAFWRAQAKRLDWTKRPTRAGDWSFDAADFHIDWYKDGELNLAVNCLDRHLETRGDKVALIFEGDEPGDARTLTYRELHDLVGRFANLLRREGVKRSERVMIYMPMIPEAAATRFDFILNTIPVSHEIDQYLQLLGRSGRMVIVGALTPMPGFVGMNLIFWNRAVGGSAIGGIPETQEMLDFCAKHDIYPDCEHIKIEQVNEAYERLLKNDVRYRFVIDMSHGL